MSIGGPDPPSFPWLRLCQDPCFYRGWIGGAMAPVAPPPWLRLWGGGIISTLF